MCTVGELIKYLSKLPSDCEVEVLGEYHSHYTTWAGWEPLVLGEDSETLYLCDGGQLLQLGGK